MAIEGISGDRLLQLPVLLFSVVIHEYAHARSAYWAGDDTAASQGRMSLNPLVHIDPWGTILVPLFLTLSRAGFIIGWARPVPVNPLRFRSSEWDLFVSLAGPGSNLILALVAAVLLKLLLAFGVVNGDVLITYLRYGYTPEPEPLGLVLLFFITLNILLALFNLIPIPPLDGSRVVYRFLASARSPLAERYVALEQYGMIILIILLISPLWRYFGILVGKATLLVLRFVF